MVDRNELIQCLTEEWDQYIAHFENLTVAEQRNFLDRQGYPSFKSLLAHLVGWWRIGIGVINHHLSDPDYTHPPIDVDAFNNGIIAQVEGIPAEDILNDFESARRQMLELITNLSDEELANPKINLQLLIEVVEHLHEHK